MGAPAVPVAAPRIDFFSANRPVLEAGTYELHVIQTVGSGTGQIPNTVFDFKRHFRVSGERFAINSTEIHSVFPPDGSSGDHSQVLPHIVLRRVTLPWERSVDGNGLTPLPWLALLLFDAANEIVTPRTISLRQLQIELGSLLAPLEPEQNPGDQVTVIDISPALAVSVIPTRADLALLAHVRQPAAFGSSPAGEALATVIGNRLPMAGGESVVHLVSLQDRYDATGFIATPGPNGKVTLVTLKSWRFVCPSHEGETFLGLLTSLDRTPPTFRHRTNPQAELEGYLARGCTLLSHTFHTGGESVSFYHGPLVPTSDGPAQVPTRAQSSDELLIYNPLNGMFDASYAAAWELGRLLALRSPKFAIELNAWRRKVNRLDQQSLVDQGHFNHLPEFSGQRNSADAPVPDSVISWLRDLSILTGVPFAYLVPSDLLLPAESLRFFRLDTAWIASLLDGALSIGRAPKDDESAFFPTNTISQPGSHASGILLRSDLVSGWPDMLVDGWQDQIANGDDAGTTHLDNLRMARLSPNILMVLFRGELGTVDIHQKPEALHFGVTTAQATAAAMASGAPGVLDIATLAGPSLDSATFAKAFLAGVQRARFVRGS